MAKKHSGPRNGSAAHNALVQLEALGGSASISQLSGALQSRFRSASRFDELVIEPLVRFQFIHYFDAEIVITRAGRAFLQPANEPQMRDVTVAGPVQAPAFKPLTPQYFAGRGLRRPGADDYRNYPSLMGGERVPYRNKS